MRSEGQFQISSSFSSSECSYTIIKESKHESPFPNKILLKLCLPKQPGKPRKASRAKEPRHQAEVAQEQLCARSSSARASSTSCNMPQTAFVQPGPHNFLLKNSSLCLVGTAPIYCDLADAALPTPCSLSHTFKRSLKATEWPRKRNYFSF